jgi:hypothetical protein
MQSHLLQVQELFEDLQLPASHHCDDDSENSADRILQRKLELVCSRRSSEALEADQEITKLISYFVNRGSQLADQASITGREMANLRAPAALPPAVRFSRASRKAIAKPLALA